MSQPKTFLEYVQQLADAYLAGAQAARVAEPEELDDEFDEDLAYERLEHGYEIEALHREIADLKQERDDALTVRDAALGQLRRNNASLHQAFAAYQTLHEALYGVGVVP